MFKYAAPPFSDAQSQAEVSLPALLANALAGARRVNTRQPNQRAKLPDGVSFQQPLSPLAWQMAGDRLPVPNRSSGNPPSPRGSDVLSWQAAQTQAMMGKLGGP